MNRYKRYCSECGAGNGVRIRDTANTAAVDGDRLDPGRDELHGGGAAQVSAAGRVRPTAPNGRDQRDARPTTR
jgi:hypothetical protein